MDYGKKLQKNRETEKERESKIGTKRKRDVQWRRESILTLHLIFFVMRVMFLKS